MSELREVHRVLVEARNVQDKSAWFGPPEEGDLEDEQPHRCALMSLCEAAEELREDPQPALAAFRAAAGIPDPPTPFPTNIPGWNNAPGRTKAEVLAAFDRAIQATAPEPDTSFLEAQDGFLARPDTGATTPTGPVKAV